MNELIGKPVDRVDGRLKVTGQAKYSAEFGVKGLTYGVAVQSTISKGNIIRIDTSKAEMAPGVITVMTYKNAPRLKQPGAAPGGNKPGAVMLGEKNLLPMQDENIHYNGQYVAVVVAGTFEQAVYAAGLVKVSYQEEKPLFEIEHASDKIYQPKQNMGQDIQFHRGDLSAGMGAAAVTIDETYITPVEHHNPMEPHATIAEWKGDHLEIHDATQNVLGARGGFAQLLGMPEEKVHVISLFLGGGFGCKGAFWPHSILAAMAAKLAKRPVKVVLDRQQMFSSNGHRSRTIQRVALGADNEGHLTAIRHDTTSETSQVHEFIEPSGLATTLLYACPNLQVTHNIVKLDKSTPTFMRAPGEASGTFAIESAMDELACKLKMDPVSLRMANYTDIDPQKNKPFSSKYLKECYSKGAEAIGWSQRNATPRSMREGKWLVGYGMATATYPANRSPASAKVRIYPDGKATGACCTQDIGTGTYTIMTQITAEALGIPLEKVSFKLGDSALPKGPGSGGSQSAASVGPAVRAAGLDAKSKAIHLSIADRVSPLYGLSETDILVEEGRMFSRQDNSKGESYAALLSRHKLPMLEGEATTNVSTRESKQKEPNKAVNSNPAVQEDEAVQRDKYAFHSFGAHFVKVLVDPVHGMVRVAKIVSVMDIGTVLNQKTAESQIMGGAIFAIGMALMEETQYDPVKGRVITASLADYLVPVHADIPEMEVHFVGKPDPYITPIGGRGIGEIGTTGAAAAIANAVFHATGKRVRNLPITPDKLL